MIIKVSWKTMINDLLKDNHKMINQVFVISRVLFYLDLKVVKCTRHNTWIFVAESLFHFLVHSFNRGNTVEFNEDHNSLFSNHFVCMVQQHYNSIINCHSHILIAQLR